MKKNFLINHSPLPKKLGKIDNLLRSTAFNTTATTTTTVAFLYPISCSAEIINKWKEAASSGIISQN